MKLFVSALLLFICFQSQAQLPVTQVSADVSGTWQGLIQVNTNLRIVVHITRKADGTYSSTLDSPDQMANGIASDATSFANNQLTFSIKRLSVNYNGTLVNDSTIEGVFKQGVQLNLTLHRTEYVAPVAIARPQTPKPTFPYKEENVVFRNADLDIQYGGTLTLPQGKGRFPCVLLITGSGQQDRNETLFGHQPFAVIADYLTRRGFAVLRVDDRGAGTTTGDFQNATTNDFVDDVNASINYLKTRSEINDFKIGLLGHSEGGLIAPMVASSRKDVRFIVMLAGPGVPMKDVLTQQNKDILIASGVNDATANAYTGLYQNVMNVLITQKDTAAAQKAIVSTINNWAAGKDASTLSALNLNTPEKRTAYSNAMVQQFSTPWFSNIISVNPQQYLTHLKKVRVLALNGAKDVQVNAQQNIAAIQNALKQGKTKVADTRILPGLNHLFQQCKTCTVSEYATLEQTFSPDALKIIGDWLDKNIK